MNKNPRRAAVPPDSKKIETLRRSAKKCLVCPFARHSTQTVFGEGGDHPQLMLVGEIPGDMEDRLGHPFVGPAGKLLHGLFEELGIDAKKVYLTNAVKHFKYVRMGKRRLHQKPNAQDIHACRPWLIKEIEAIQPTVMWH
jgi:DNA polymerase